MKFYYLCLFFLSSFLCSAQNALQWQKSMGGKNAEYAYASTPTSDGGYIIVGNTTNNNDGDVPVSKAFTGAGGNDIWVVKVDNWGEIVWSKTFGGTKDDIATDVLETKDKNILILATTASSDGDALGNGSRGGLLLLKLKMDGSIIWRKVFASGFSVGEIAYNKADANSKPSIKSTSDGGYIIGANVTPLNNRDLWLGKITDTGNLQWSKTFGSIQHDWLNEVVVCSDGGFLMIGGTEANANEITGAGKGFIDIYIIKTDATGKLLWQKALGGANLDQAFAGIETADKGYLVVGETNSTNADMVGNLGQKDGFILKLRNDGQLLSKVLTGGTEMDGLYTIRQSTMGKIYAMGQSSSIIGQVKPKGPVGDIWIATIETNGNVSNHAMLGGADTDIARGATPTSDGGFIIAGNSDSVDGDVTKNNGATDFWLVKVGLPLPATLRSFTATITPEQSIKLNWLSLNETKSKNFTIERSFDQIKFTALGQVTAAGTTATAKAYTFTDQKPVFGKNYYRLKVYDEANKEYIYKTVSVVVYILANEPLVVDNGLTVFPNPIKEPAFYIHTTQILPKHISFFNGIGNPLPIEAESIDSTQTKISIKQEISAGIYFLVLDFDGNKIIKKVIVQ